jgi:ABC-type transport system involved in cytochrome bd biosynthesis fused ATPase/permease subunit
MRDASTCRKELDDAWPRHGALAINDITLRYRPNLAPAIQNISADILPGERIGIVGRTVCHWVIVSKQLIPCFFIILHFVDVM